MSPTTRSSGTAVGPNNVRADQSIEYHYVYVTTQTQAKKNAAITQTSTTTRVVTDDIRSCYFYEGHGVHSYADPALCEGLYSL